MNQMLIDEDGNRDNLCKSVQTEMIQTYILPPRSWPLIEITAAPIQTIMKIMEKTTEASSWAFRLSKTARFMQRKNGPHRSQSRSSARISRCRLSVDREID